MQPVTDGHTYEEAATGSRRLESLIDFYQVKVAVTSAQNATTGLSQTDGPSQL